MALFTDSYVDVTDGTALAKDGLADPSGFILDANRRTRSFILAMHTLPYVPAATREERAAGMRVLLGDDEPAIRMVVARYLKGRGHQVETAADGGDALERIRAGEAFDRILADLHMPGMGGAELYHRLAARGLDDRL